MTEEQNKIKERVIELKQEIVKCFNPDNFELNNKLSDLYSEWSLLQNSCDHIFEKGKCILCECSERQEVEE